MLGLNKVFVDLLETNSKEEVMQTIEEYIKKNQVKNGDWIRGFGWDQTKWENTSFPTRYDLDANFPNNPIFLERLDGHAGWTNSLAIEIANLPETNPTGGEIMRFFFL